MGIFREIPVIAEEWQQLSTTLARQDCDITIRYDDRANRWALDLVVNGKPVLAGRFIHLGVDLLQRLRLDMGMLFAVSWEAGAEPGWTELPAGRVRLLHYEETP